MIQIWRKGTERSISQTSQSLTGKGYTANRWSSADYFMIHVSTESIRAGQSTSPDCKVSRQEVRRGPQEVMTMR